MKKELQILAFTNGTASHVWRFDAISRRINEQTKHSMFTTTHEAWNNDIVGANLVILEMLASSNIVDTCHNLGAKVIYEADDAIIDTYGRERKNLQQLNEKFRGSAIETIRKCDAITVTNEHLAENYRRFTDKPIHVLPIYMDYRYYGDAINIKLSERNTSEVRIGWFGSKGHFEDLRMIVPALKEVLEKYKEAKFVYVGYGEGGQSASQIGIWGEEEVFKEIPRERREFAPGAPAEYWPFKHRLLDFDIGIAPLIDDDFNKNKVNTKWLEYSVLEIPTVASSTVYGEHIDHGKNSFIADTHDEWVEYLSKLIEGKALRNRMGKAAAKEVKKNWNIDDHWMEWVKIYEDML